jgi:hypothetical protein
MTLNRILNGRKNGLYIGQEITHDYSGVRKFKKRLNGIELNAIDETVNSID